MAYTGFNKADWESRKFMVGADARRNTVSTIASTGLQVLDTIYENAKVNEIERLNNEATNNLQIPEQEIFKNIPPEEWEQKLQELHAGYADQALSTAKSLPGVKKQFINGLRNRRTINLSKERATLNQKEIQQNEQFGTNQLDNLVNAANVYEFAKSGGLIADRDLSLAKPEESSLASGFLDNPKNMQLQQTEKEENSVFSADLHQAYVQDVGQFEFGVKVIEHYANRMHPFNAKMRDMVVAEYTDKLRDKLPEHDLDINFAATFNRSTIDQWDYVGERRAYESQLAIESYGGQSLTEAKKEYLLAKFDAKYENLVEGIKKEAQTIYDERIAVSVTEKKLEHAQNANKPFLPEHVDEIYTAVVKDSGLPEKYFRSMKEVDLYVAKNNEKLKQQSDFRSLYKLGQKRTEQETNQMFELSKLFTTEQLETLKLQAMDSAKNISNIAISESRNAVFINDAKLYNDIDYGIVGGKYGSQKAFDDAITEAKLNGLTEDAATLLEASYSKHSIRKKQYAQENLLEADKRLGAKAYYNSLSITDVRQVGEQLGLSPEEQPEFYEEWTAKAEANGQTNAVKMFNAIDFEDGITAGQVDHIAQTYGIDKSNPLYKAWKQKAEQNWDKHLSKISATKQGFLEKSEEGATTTVADQIGLYRDKQITKAEALTELQKNRKKMSYEDYSQAYNEINNTALIHHETKLQAFNEEVLRPFLDEQDTIMPGMSENRLKQAGLDPLDFQPELSEMRDVEAMNQHRKQIPQYVELQTYLQMAQLGITDNDIEKMGFKVPDISHTKTLKWAAEHNGETYQSPVAYAKEQLRVVESLMITDTLPSGKAFGGSSSASTLEKTITESAKRMHKDLISSLRKGAKVDNSEAIAYLNLKRYELEDNEYDKLLWSSLERDQITEATYLERVAEDISVYKSPEYKERSEAINTFEKYVRDVTSHAKDKDGKSIDISLIGLDTAVENAKSVFLEEYDYARKNSNGAPIVMEDIIKRSYDRVVNTKYESMADDFVSTIKADSSTMYRGVLGQRQTDSYKLLETFEKGEAFLVDKSALVRMLSDPEAGASSLGVESGVYGVWDSMYRNGKSSEEVGRQVLLDTARFLNLTGENGSLAMPTDIASNSFDAEFGDFIKNLPDVSKNQLMQTAMIAKWTIDVKQFAQKELGQELINGLDPEGIVTPIITEGNRLGVSIGDTELFFNQGGSKGETTFSYVGEGGVSQLASKQSLLKSETQSFEYKLGLSLSGYNIAGLDIVNLDAEGNALPVNMPALENHLEMVVENAKNASSFKRAKTNYLSVLNQKVSEYNALLKTNDLSYDDLELYVDYKALMDAHQGGTLLDTPLDAFVRYRLVQTKQ